MDKLELKYGWKKQILTYCLEFCGFALAGFVRLFSGKPTSSGEQRILLIEPFQMGDVAALSLLFQPLKKKYPEAKLYILSRKGPGMVATTFLEVSGVLHSNFPWIASDQKGLRAWQSWFKNLISFRKLDFFLGIDVRGDVRSQLSLKLAGCQKVLSYQQYIYSDLKAFGFLTDFLVGKAPYMHIFDRNRFLLTGLGLLEKDLFPIQFPTFHPKEPYQIQPELKPILVHTGASWEFKRWEAERWAKVITQIESIYPNPVLLISVPSEAILVEEILSYLPDGHRARPIFPPIDELIHLLQSCQILIGLDSGPMCIANCLNVPRLALFGPGVPEVWRPYQQGSGFIQHTEKFSCYPCIQKICYFPEHSCMKEIEADEVSEAIAKVLVQ